MIGDLLHEHRNSGFCFRFFSCFNQFFKKHTLRLCPFLQLFLAMVSDIVVSEPTSRLSIYKECILALAKGNHARHTQKVRHVEKDVATECKKSLLVEENWRKDYRNDALLQNYLGVPGFCSRSTALKPLLYISLKISSSVPSVSMFRRLRESVRLTQEM